LLLSLSAKGMEIIYAVSPASKDVYADLEARYGRKRLDDLLDMLGDLAALKTDQ